ncbi:MAG: hypothetical protein EOO60_00765 [Hymenobacter sp.]|nr:MAG: hypothetical protein EOO60_00765 [Hymenobacter sp.]
MKQPQSTLRLATWCAALALGSLLVACSPQGNDLPEPQQPTAAQRDTTHVPAPTPIPAPVPPRDTTHLPVPPPPPAPVPPRDTTRTR